MWRQCQYNWALGCASVVIEKTKQYPFEKLNLILIIYLQIIIKPVWKQNFNKRKFFEKKKTQKIFTPEFETWSYATTFKSMVGTQL